MPSSTTPPATSEPTSTPATAEAAALRLAAEAGALELARAAADPDDESDTLETLLAHELAAGHLLMMRLAARAGDFLDHAADGPSPEAGRAGLEAARLAGAAGRLMERTRLGLLALHKLRAADGGAVQRVVLRWGGCPHEGCSEHVPDDDDPDDGPDDDGPGGGATPPAAPLPSSGASPAGRRGRLRNGNPSGDYAAAPRCGARTRAGGCCRQPAMANGRCRLHGGKSTGPRTAAGLARCRAARRRHGARSADLAVLRRAAASSARRLRLLAAAGRAIPAGHGVHRRFFAPARETIGSEMPNAMPPAFSAFRLDQRGGTGEAWGDATDRCGRDRTGRASLDLRTGAEGATAPGNSQAKGPQGEALWKAGGDAAAVMAGVDRLTEGVNRGDGPHAGFVFR